jgi:hypothetical protein
VCINNVNSISGMRDPNPQTYTTAAFSAAAVAFIAYRVSIHDTEASKAIQRSD